MHIDYFPGTKMQTPWSYTTDETGQAASQKNRWGGLTPPGTLRQGREDLPPPTLGTRGWEANQRGVMDGTFKHGD